jgi:spermidine/putrescine transport system substrate-binding protein
MEADDAFAAGAPRGPGEPRQGFDLDPALLRGLTQSRLSRRDFVRAGATAAAVAGLGSVLSACGIAGTRDTGAPASFDWSSWWSKQQKHGVLDWANWPLYIDTSHGRHPSLERFTKQTGIHVNYRPVIQENASFFAQISPVLQARQGIGYDLIVISDGWELTQMIANRWLIPLDHSRIPNFRRHAGPIAVHPSFDPRNRYTVTWQAGITGIGYDPRMTGREITSVKDLWDPAFKGKVGMMSDDTELGSVGMLALGIDPVSSTPADWKRAAALLTKQRDEGLVRQYYDQSYIKALEDGDTWISQAWSGDIFQANYSGFKHLKFVIPKEGGMLWHDNCMIPLHAQNPVDALEWVNFYYQPPIQAMIEDWVNYLCPVPAAKGLIANKLNDPSVADSQLVFPSPSTNRRLRDYYDFRGIDDHDEWTSIFQPVYQS